MKQDELARSCPYCGAVCTDVEISCVPKGFKYEYTCHSVVCDATYKEISIYLNKDMESVPCSPSRSDLTGQMETRKGRTFGFIKKG